MEGYNHKDIERKWQEKWKESKLYGAKDGASKEKSKYFLTEFPYPSGNLHVGHWYAFAVFDIYVRKKRMEGFNVLYPIGFDAFGLPAENAAIKRGLNPREWTNDNIEYMRSQLQSMGASFDWSREVITSDPSYYRWTQKLFADFFRDGLAEIKETEVNWCPSCKTVLANEQVASGECERCDSEVEKKEMKQWALKITDYAERLLEDLEGLDWPDEIKAAQRAWIGKSEGAEIKFEVRNTKSETNPKSETPNSKPSKVVLVHGSNATEKKSKVGEPENMRHWKPWLKEELEKHGIEVSNELYPKDWVPDYDAWKKVFEKNNIGENTILVGHSAGTAFILRWLNETRTKVKKVILVAPSVIKSEKYKRLSTLKDFNFDSSLKDCFDDLVIFYSDDDNKNIIKSAKQVNEVLGGELIHLENRGHFVESDMRTKEFPELLDEIFALRTIPVFTTRPDTIFGATYLVIAPEHEFVAELLKNQESRIRNQEEVGAYVEKAKRKSELERKEAKEKTGVLLEGMSAINPATGEEISIWVADYVLSDVGTGAIMAVPAHDARDLEFAKKFDLPVRQVVAPETGEPREDEEERHGGCGVVLDPKSGLYAVGEQKDGTFRLFSGGVDESEEMKEGILREIREESGLVNFKYVENIGMTFSHFYNSLRKVNRVAEATCLLVVLENTDREEPILDEHEDFELKWVTAEELLDNWRKRNDSKDLDHWIWFLKQAVGRAIELGYDKTSNSQIFIRRAHEGEGVLMNSGEFDGMRSEKAREAMTEKFGEKKTTYKMRDWVVSRQRYWGCPIPLVFCEHCAEESRIKNQELSRGEKLNPGWFAVPEKDLPVELPEIKDFKPAGDGKSPLAKSKEFVETRCPNCGGEARRETDTLDTFVDSSWYFLRYTDPHNEKAFADKEKQDKWMPVDLYSGGAEHTTMHLLYSRFFHKALFDIGLVSEPEPYRRRMNRGLILGPDGNKMSKSKGNVIDPDEVVERLGADTVRSYLSFIGPYNETGYYPWDPDGVVGVRRFIERVFKISEKVRPGADISDEVRALTHKSIKKVTEDIDALKFNTALSQLMIFSNTLIKEDTVSEEVFGTLLKLLAPFAPHAAEELWHSLGNDGSIHEQEWPEYEEKYLKSDTLRLAVQVDGKVREEIEVGADTPEESVKEEAIHVVQKWLEGREVERVIVVPKKLINIVLKKQT